MSSSRTKTPKEVETLKKKAMCQMTKLDLRDFFKDGGITRDGDMILRRAQKLDRQFFQYSRLES